MVISHNQLLHSDESAAQTRRPDGKRRTRKISVRPIWLHEPEDRPDLVPPAEMSENVVTDREKEMGQSDKIREHQAGLIR
jgi:hypothetical protein